MLPGPARLEVHSLNKSFGPTRVLNDIDLTVLAGEVHGLVGQNGSGKSTLIKILTGYHSPDPGAEYKVDGREVHLPVRWKEVHAAGVSVVHQDLGLLDHLSVAENICVGGFPTSHVLHRIQSLQRDRLAAATLARLGIDIAPTAPVGALSAAQRAEVAIARALRDQRPGSGLVILDEATRALAGDDLARIHRLLRSIAAEGSAALMISHNLPELLSTADRLTVLRDGRVTGAGLATRDLDEQEVARRMLGKTLSVQRSRPTVAPPEAVRAVTVSGLSGARVKDLDISVNQGEIVGITGMPGNGYEEIPYLLTGAERAVAGVIRTDKREVDLTRSTVSGCIRAGIVLVPERRERDGLAFERNVRDNISLPALNRRGRPWFVSKRWQQEDAAAAGQTFNIRPRMPSILVKQLSGGNQQKVLLAKWFMLGPSLLVLHEPTQGVDVGARDDILRQVRRAVQGGMAAILVTSEPADLAAACDRVLLYSATTGLEEIDSADPDTIIEHVYAAAEAMSS